MYNVYTNETRFKATALIKIVKCFKEMKGMQRLYDNFDIVVRTIVSKLNLSCEENLESQSLNFGESWMEMEVPIFT